MQRNNQAKTILNANAGNNINEYQKYKNATYTYAYAYSILFK